MSLSNWEMVDDGSFNGLRKWMRSSDDDHGTVQVSYEQINLKQILDDNKRAQNESLDRKSEMWHAAKIPAIIQVEWLSKHGIDLNNPNHAEGARRLLNSSEYAHLKRAPIVI